MKKGLLSKIFIFTLVSGLFILQGCNNDKVKPEDMYYNAVISETRYNAFVNDAKVCIVRDGSEITIDEIDNAKSIYGNDNEIVILCENGQVFIYSVDDNKIITEPFDYKFEEGATAPVSVYEMQQLQNNLMQLTGVHNIFMDYPSWYVATDKNGNAISCDSAHLSDKDMDAIKSMDNIIKCVSYEGGTGIVVLLETGKVSGIGVTDDEKETMDGWTDIIDIKVFDGGFYGLKSDDTIVSTSFNHVNDIEKRSDIDEPDVG